AAVGVAVGDVDDRAGADGLAGDAEVGAEAEGAVHAVGAGGEELVGLRVVLEDAGAVGAEAVAHGVDDELEDLAEVAAAGEALHDRDDAGPGVGGEAEVGGVGVGGGHGRVGG